MAVPRDRKPSAEPTRGRPRKIGATKAFLLRLPPDLHKDLRHHAVERDVSMNDLLTKVISEWWNETDERGEYVRVGRRNAAKRS